MKSTAVAAAGVFAIVTLGQAKASTIYDSYLGGSYSDSSDSVSNSVTGMAASFSAAGQSFNQINLQISAPAGSSGSTMVYLVPDNGVAQGAPGNASSIFNSAHTPTAFDGTYHNDLLTTILDSRLGNGPALYSISVSNFPTSSNGEYWLVLIPSGGLQWAYGMGSNASYVEANGAGLTNQLNAFYNTTASDINPFGWNLTSDINDVASGDSGPYAFQVVNTPEPASAAILGSALIGAGVVRRRSRRMAA